MRRAVSAYQRWPERTFPRVLWVVPDRQRADYIKAVTKAQSINLFDVVLFEDAITHLTK